MSSPIEATPVFGYDTAAHAAREGGRRAQVFFENNPKMKAIAEVIGYLGYCTLSVRSAGFVFLATPIGISAGLVYGSATYLSHKVYNQIFKGEFRFKELFKHIASAYIAQTALSLALGVKISFTASVFIPIAPILAGIIGAGTIAYWGASAIAIIGFASMAFDFENTTNEFFKQSVAREEIPSARVAVHPSGDISEVQTPVVAELIPEDD